MGACSAVAVEAAVTGAGTEVFQIEKCEACQTVEVTVAMAGFVVEKTGEGGKLLIRGIIFIGNTIIKEHCLMGAFTGDLRMKLRGDSMREDGVERKVTFTKAFRAHATPFIKFAGL